MSPFFFISRAPPTAESAYTAVCTASMYPSISVRKPSLWR